MKHNEDLELDLMSFMNAWFNRRKIRHKVWDHFPSQISNLIALNFSSIQTASK